MQHYTCCCKQTLLFSFLLHFIHFVFWLWLPSSGRDRNYWSEIGGKMWKRRHTQISLLSFIIFTAAALRYEFKVFGMKDVLKEGEVKLFVTAGCAWKSWRRKRRSRSGMTVTGLRNLRMRWQRETGESFERITTSPSRVSDSSDIACSDHAAYHEVKPKMLFSASGNSHFTVLSY